MCIHCRFYSIEILVKSFIFIFIKKIFLKDFIYLFMRDRERERERERERQREAEGETGSMQGA